MGGKKASKAAAREAAQARADEQARQQRIREGTANINRIFDGGTYGTDQVGAGTAYDPSQTYYKADGSVWTPPAALGTGGGGVSGNPFLGASLNRDGGNPIGSALSGLVGALSNKGRKDPWETALDEGLFTGTATGTGFNDDYFAKQRQAFIDYATPQLDDQHGKAQKELTFSLARSGLLDSSTRGEKLGDLQKAYDLNSQQIADQALAHEGTARTAVEDARQNLIATLNATGDATGAANSAIARASALTQPAAYSPLGNLFADFTSALGTQSALERANAYSGGQTGLRYATGLFAPGARSTVVQK